MLKSRRYLVIFIFAGLFFFLFVRLFCIQVVDRKRYSALADTQHNTTVAIEPRRGTIFDRYMDTLALNMDVYSVFCDPRVIRDRSAMARILSEELNIDSERLEARLDSDRAFIWVKRKIDRDTYIRLREMKLTGVHFRPESRRKYPNEIMASHLLGFTGIDNDGLEGLELFYDKELRGRPGRRHITRDARMRAVLRKDALSIPAHNGNNLVLTIDSVIQYIVEEELAAMMDRSNAQGGTIVVMEPSTGKILALAGRPAYDPNEISRADPATFRNPVVSEVYEPGSVFKIVAASAVLEESTMSLSDTVHCGNGQFQVGGRLLRDFRPHGELSFEDVIAVSSNIGIVKAAIELGEKKLFEYIRDFGFGEVTGIDLPGEVSGISRHPRVWSRSDITTIPMGQGIAVTSIQLASAVSVIANEGVLMRPYITDEITTWEGVVIKKTDPVKKRRVISEKTSEKMKRALRKVVTDGTGRRAFSRRYVTCGKTGTAQMASPEGGYYSDRYYAAFIGFAPLDVPAISVVVVARDPRPDYFGGTVAAPVFRRITERVLEYLGVQETTGEAVSRASL